MKPNEINKNCESISDVLQGLYKELSKIRGALQDVENARENDYSWLDEESTQEEKEIYINREIYFAKKMADKAVKKALMGILRKSNEITNKALGMIEEEIEF